MLNTIALINALNENFSDDLHEGYSSIPAMNLSHLDAAEACSASRMAVMQEAVTFRQTCVQADEIITEAVLSNRYDDVRSEGVFSAIADKAKKVIDKIIAAVKGTIERIKAFFFKLTGKTDKWIKVMGPRLNAARKTANQRRDLDYEMHEWDQGYINSIPDNIDKLVNGWKNAVDGVSFESIKADAVRAASSAMSTEGYKEEDDEAYQENKEHDENLDEYRKSFEDGLMKNISTAFGVDVSDRSDVAAEINKKCMNGSTEKISVKVSDILDSAWKAIERSSKIRDKLTETYNGYLKKLEGFKSKINKNTDFKFPDSKDKSATHLESIRTRARNLIADQVWATEQVHSMVTSIQQVNFSALNTMVQEYMNAITAYCNGRPAKKED